MSREKYCGNCLHYCACLRNAEYTPTTPCCAYEDKADYRKQSEGVWLDTGDEQLDKIYSGYKCSACGFIICGHSGNYCPDCGAKMKGRVNTASNPWLTCFDIQGKLTDLAPSNVAVTYEFAQTCVGKPILDDNELQMGIIEAVDFEKGCWYGRIVVNASIRDVIWDECRSMSMEVRDE